jgi:arylsulfatase A-like enzyme
MNTRVPRLLASLVLAALAVPWSGCDRGTGPQARQPRNVLLVTLDTTRADYIGCYEPQRAANTPHLNALAADGTQFLRCISASAATPVSHASILTGLYPFEHGLRVIYAKSGCRLKADVPYLPALLQAAGWRTAAFLSAFTVSEFYGFQRGFDTFDSGLTRAAEGIMRPDETGHYEWGVVDNQRRSDHTTDAALAWLDQASPRTPFFLWVHYWDPHDWTPGVPETAPPPEFSRPFMEAATGSGPDQLRAMYAAEVAFVDLQFGRLIDKLKARGCYDDTLIVVLADHGQGLGDHNWWPHRLLYQEQIHLPLIVRMPAQPGGRRIDSLVRSIDVYPTILEAVGVPSPQPVTGESLLGLLQGHAGEPRYAYADGPHKYDLNAAMLARRPKDGNLYCLTDGTWKLLLRLDNPDDSELFNLASDPREARNVYRTEVAQAERLRRILDDLNPYQLEPFADEGRGDRGALKALESLGYVGSRADDQIEPDTQPTSRNAPSDD